MSIAILNKTYSYRCRFCDACFDITLTGVAMFEDISKDDALIFCPLCGSDDLVRDYKEESKSVIFKGKGFYSTDNREKEE